MASLASENSIHSSTQEDQAAWKASLAAGRDALRRQYLERPAPGVLLRRHRALVDDHLLAAWRHLQMPASVALVAVGGFGRGELFPFSDIDILVLLADAADEALAGKLERFVGVSWDMGLAIGHSVRNVEECVTLGAADVTIETNLLEARLLAGDSALFAHFRKRFAEALDIESFANAKRLEQEQRHARYRDTNLEPNIKETAGGLRDLHNILWIAKAAQIGAAWSDLAKKEIITVGEARKLRQHESFLEDLRIRLHYLANRREERLVFDVQTALARQFGLRDTAHRLASEQLMQRFYRTAKEITQINTVVLQNLDVLLAPGPRLTARKITPDFRIRNELLEARDEGLFRERSGAMFEAVVLLQKHHEVKGMSARTLRALWRAAAMINPAFRASPANRALFMEILRSPTHVARALALMNQYGMLGRYIPAFGRIVGQMQHDLYHVYTVDEHILNVIRNWPTSFRFAAG
jgi:[protein-PII] uridylyltransferase